MNLWSAAIGRRFLDFPPWPTLPVLIAAVLLFVARYGPAAEEKITYADHVRPILREHCFACHNQNKAQNDLKLDSYETLIKGGASGAAIVPGDADGSYLWSLVSHEDEPYMPPKQDKLSDEKLAVIKKWIDGGALKDSGSTAVVKKQAGLELKVAAGAKPQGPAVMPEGLRLQPFVHTGRPGALTALATSPWAPLAAVAGQEQIALYHTDTGRLLGVLPFPEGIPYVLRFSRSGALVLAGGGKNVSRGLVVVYDVKTGKRLFQVGDELDAVLAADISPDQSRIALAGPQRIVRVFSAADGSLIGEIRKHTDWVYAVQFSPDGVLLATADRSAGLFLWEAETLHEFQNLQGHKGPVTGVSWRDDSNVLASASEDGTIRLWNVEQGKELRAIKAHPAGATDVMFAHDGRLCSCGRDRVTKLWDASGKQLRALPALTDVAMKAAFSHDGGRVIAGDWSGLVRIWNASDGKPVADLSSNPPTLEMTLAAAEKRLAETRSAEAKAAAELKAAEKTLAERREASQKASQAAAQAAQEAAKAAAEKAAIDKNANRADQER